MTDDAVADRGRGPTDPVDWRQLWRTVQQRAAIVEVHRPDGVSDSDVEAYALRSVFLYWCTAEEARSDHDFQTGLSDRILQAERQRRHRDMADLGDQLTESWRFAAAQLRKWCNPLRVPSALRREGVEIAATWLDNGGHYS